MYGSKFATTSAELLNTAKGTAAWLVPLRNVSTSIVGTWHAVIVVAVLMKIAIASLALFVLRSIRRQMLDAEELG